ncbi:MAG TPA: enoyl-CoA hydratase/isomerase family protein, partial [Tepidiformaceae bacterium]|nr:enoyl-CoA hydratase/isomerase family protein [Tepidiformaceae bacterium]
MSDCIVERHGGVMLIRFNRPEKMNSLGGTLMQEFSEAFREGTADDAIRCFVVTGEGRAWNAGADLSGAGITQIGKTKQTFAQEMNTLGGVGQVALQVWNCDKPTIAAVNGVCAGGGFGFVTCFDRRIASDQARFTTVFIRRALASDFGLSWFLPRLVGLERAQEMY